MKNLFEKLFGKKKVEVEEEDVERYEFITNLYMKKGASHEIVGYYTSASETANVIVDFMAHNTVFTATTINGNKLVIRGEDVEYVRVKGEPIEREEY